MRYPLSESFLRYFDVQYVDSQALRDEVHGIRYRVYCEEFAYEPIESFPDGLEKDEFDQ